MSMISEQVREMREIGEEMTITTFDPKYIQKIILEAADTIEALSVKVAAENMGRSEMYYNGGWLPADEPPKDSKEVLIFNGKSYSVGYYDGKEWINAIHPVKWKPIEQ